MQRSWVFLLLEGGLEDIGRGVKFLVSDDSSPRRAGASGANDLGCWKDSGGIGIFLGLFLSIYIGGFRALFHNL